MELLILKGVKILIISGVPLTLKLTYPNEQLIPVFDHYIQKENPRNYIPTKHIKIENPRKLAITILNDFTEIIDTYVT